MRIAIATSETLGLAEWINDNTQDLRHKDNPCYLDKIVNGLQVEEVVVRYVDADAKVETGVAPVDDLVVAKLHKIGVLGVSH